MNIFKAMRFSLIIIPMIVTGQNLKKDLTKLSYDELKNLYFDSNTPKKELINYANAYLNKGKKEKKEERISRGFYFKALLFYNIDDKKAIQLLDSVIKYSKNGNDSFFPSAAYCEKGNLLVNQHQYREALKSFNLGEKNAKNSNIDYYYIIRANIAITKSEKLGQVSEALDIYKECYKFYKTKNVHDIKYSADYQSVIFGIADVYKSLNKNDSCSFYNDLGYREAKATKNENFKSLFVLNEGANQILKKNYRATIDSISNALPQIIANNNTINIIASYYYYGKAYEGLNKKDLATLYFKKVDSIYQNNKDILTPEFIDGYKFLISYYKERKDTENQLKYISTYMEIDSALNENYKEFDKILQKDYDIPHLIKDKETLINSLRNKSNYYYWWLIFLITIILGLAYNQKRLKNLYQKRFEKLLSENFSNNEKEILSLQNKKQIEDSENKSLGISDEIINQILEKLNEFELENHFLNSSITIQSLAETFKTNSRYLSKIINEYKGKSFIQYINDLRIEFAITDLKSDYIKRKYTLQALASEFGFNNAESFSSAFYKNTGIKPSYFIKELEKT